MPFDDFYLQLEKELPYLTIHEIKNKLITYPMRCTPQLVRIPAHSCIFRARKYDKTLLLDDPVCIKQLSYPTPDNATKGRLNRAQEPVFYGSQSLIPVIFEVEDLEENDNLILSIWRSTMDLTFCSAGYIRSINPQQMHDISLYQPFHLYRPSPDTNNLPPYNMSDWIHSAFVRTVPNSKDYLYNLSIALAEIHLESALHPCHGVIYPSSQVWPAGDNMALRPDTADYCLVFEKAYQLHVVQLSPNHIKLNPMAYASKADRNGDILWAYDYELLNHVA